MKSLSGWLFFSAISNRICCNMRLIWRKCSISPISWASSLELRVFCIQLKVGKVKQKKKLPYSILCNNRVTILTKSILDNGAKNLISRKCTNLSILVWNILLIPQRPIINYSYLLLRCLSKTTRFVCLCKIRKYRFNSNLITKGRNMISIYHCYSYKLQQFIVTRKIILA